MTFHKDWEQWQTGGGCLALAWGPEPDAGGNHRLYIMATTFEGAALPESDSDVMIGLYDDRERDSEGDAFIRVTFDEFLRHDPEHWFQGVRERGVPDAIDLYEYEER